MRTSTTPARSWRRVAATALATVLVVAGELALLDTVYHRGDDVRAQQVLQAELHGVLGLGRRPRDGRARSVRAQALVDDLARAGLPADEVAALEAGLADARAGRTEEAVAASEAVGDAVRGRSEAIDRQADLVYAVLLVVVSIGWFLWFRRLVQRHRALQQRVTAQESLEASEKRLMALVQNGSELVTVLDAGGRTTYVSPSSRVVLGLEPEEVLGTAMVDHVLDDDVQTVVAQVSGLGPGESRAVRVRVRHADGRVLVLEGSLTNLLDEPAVSGLVLTLRDVTERHALQERLAVQAFYDDLTGLANRQLFMDRLAHALGRGADGSYAADGRGGHRPVLRRRRLQDRQRQPRPRLRRRAADDRRPPDRRRRAPRRHRGPARRRRVRRAARPHPVRGRDAGRGAARGGPRGAGHRRRDVGAGAAQHRRGHRTRAARPTSRSCCATPTWRCTRPRAPAARPAGRPPRGTRRPCTRRRSSGSRCARSCTARWTRSSWCCTTSRPSPSADGRITGFEALVRWQHPERGLVPPAAFIPLAEETGLVVRLGSWVLREACRQAVALQPRGPVTMAVNVAAQQLAHPGFVQEVLGVLAETGLPPHLLVVEITESVVMSDLAAASPRLAALREHGIRVAIDDFGTGYSSLAYLSQLPVDVLKVDKTFVDHVASGQDDASITQAIIAMSHRLGLSTVAEGVEEADQHAWLREARCDLGRATCGAGRCRPTSCPPCSRGRRCRARCRRPGARTPPGRSATA